MLPILLENVKIQEVVVHFPPLPCLATPPPTKNQFVSSLDGVDDLDVWNNALLLLGIEPYRVLKSTTTCCDQKLAAQRISGRSMSSSVSPTPMNLIENQLMTKQEQTKPHVSSYPVA